MFTSGQRNYGRVAESEGRELHDCKANSTGGLLGQNKLEERAGHAKLVERVHGTPKKTLPPLWPLSPYIHGKPYLYSFLPYTLKKKKKKK